MKKQKIEKIRDEARQILDSIHKDQKVRQSYIAGVEEIHKKSATNLINYLSLRSFDIRNLQRRLGYLGMSRLARAEAHVEASLLTTLRFLDFLLEKKVPESRKYTISIKKSEKTLQRNTDELLGKARGNRRLRIMVTIPNKAVEDYQLVEDMVANGMDCARINCAHDTPDDWLKMIEHIKKASKKLDMNVAITMDVGGPKIRTGEIVSGPAIKHFTPLRNPYGKVIYPAIINLVNTNKTDLSSEDLPVTDARWLGQLKKEDTVAFKDTRGKKRKLHVIESSHSGVLTHSYDSAYIETGTELISEHGNAQVSSLPPIDQNLFLKNDDRLFLYKTVAKGKPAKYDKNGKLLEPASISCTLPEVLDYVETGDPIFFDDGEIKGEIEEMHQDFVVVKINHAKSGGAKLKSDKGINLPDTNLQISGLTEKDKKDLKFIAKHADAVNFSFVQSSEDVNDMLKELDKLGVRDKLGIILKIETQKGYDNLTRILFEAMKTKKIGVMIARGDMAIEAGWRRMGSIQKEMLAICNAAHVPVVWATQVLEHLAKKGLPARSEITDAVNAAKAECVMLNKGPYIIEAIQLLDQLIVSSEVFQYKNAPMLPKLRKIAKKH